MLCKDIDECANSDGGCDPLRQCKNTPGSHYCDDCSAGYANDGKTACKDIDECKTNNGGCHPERKCVNTDAWIKESDHKKLGELLFKATRDGWNAYHDFHSRCDDQGPTLTVFKSPEGYIYGGYTQASWREVGGNYVEDWKAWLYWIKCKQGIPERKMNVRTDGNQVHAIYPHNSYGPTFGGGHDIYISDDMHNGYVNWGSSYPLPSGYDNSFLTGVGGAQTHQMASEIEVYKVI